MSVLVIGGAGYIGSHVCAALREEGFRPVVYDNLSTGHLWAIRDPFIRADLEDEEALRRSLNELRPEAIIHLASLINVRDSIADPGLYYEKNVLGTLVLLRAMVNEGMSKIVFSSTAAVYGAPRYVPIDEDHPKCPLNAYGKTKWTIEGMFEDFAHAHGLGFAILRYFNACGASLTSEIGEAHEPETHLIPLAIRRALEQSVLPIYGDDYPTPDGTAIRDYVHVLDLADAHVKALRHLLSSGSSLQINLGTGAGHSVRQIIEAVEAFGGKKIPTQILPRFVHDSPVLVADSTKARQILGWNPQHSNLSTIVSTAWNWEVKSPRTRFQKLKSFNKSLNL